jgi:hypothetical protein
MSKAVARIGQTRGIGNQIGRRSSRRQGRGATGSWLRSCNGSY